MKILLAIFLTFLLVGCDDHHEDGHHHIEGGLLISGNNRIVISSIKSFNYYKVFGKDKCRIIFGYGMSYSYSSKACILLEKYSQSEKK